MKPMRAENVPTVADMLLTGHDQTRFHERAAAQRDQYFGRQVFVRGVVEVSNICRENCTYCGMRRDNRSLARYRANAEELTELLLNHRPPSMTDLNIQTGEDPGAIEEIVLPLLRTLREKTSLGLSVCLGTLSESHYRELQKAGASVYIMKFEIAEAEAYKAFKAPGNLEERLEHIRLLVKAGWNVSSGFIAGLPGQGPEAILHNLQLAVSLPLRGCSVSPFIPGDETPLAGERSPGSELTLNSMAWMRLMRPDWVIPVVSALNLAEPGEGYRRGLRTGANLCTINLTPEAERGQYLLYKRDRFIMNEERIHNAVEKEGLSISTTSLAAHFDGSKAQPVVAT
jgi:biotin synthase